MLESVESFWFVPHKARLTGEFDSKKDSQPTKRLTGEFNSRKNSQPTKLQKRARILVNLRFKELRDSELSDLCTFDSMAISLN